MAYIKTTWETGDVITADKLNNIECGIEAVSVETIDTILTEGAETNTLTNADKLLSAINAISEDVTKIINYIVVVTYIAGPGTFKYAGRFVAREHNYDVTFSGGTEITYNADDGFSLFGRFTFTEEDIDENGVATLHLSA